MMGISYRDNRMINLPLSDTFYKLLFRGLPQEMSYLEAIHDIKSFDEDSGNVLLKLYNVYKYIYNSVL